MPPPYPQLLFTGSRIIDEANQITSKVRDSISRASLASLNGTQVDDLVQKLYTENEIVLPFLKRDDAVKDQFEFFYAPYLQMMLNIDFTKLQDRRHGVIFSVDVPYVGDKRYFRSRPNQQVLNPPLGVLGDDKITIFVPAANLTLQEMQAAFNAIIDNIEDHLKRLAETLRDWPMSFHDALVQAINSRLDTLNRAAQISAGLSFKPKQRANAPDLTIPLARTQIKPAPINLNLPAEQQLLLAEETYQHILSVMQNMSLVMEYSPKAFEGLGEEALRFHFLVQLNGQYEGSATGETFNGEGKSDILIRQNNTNLFVAECKIWEGVSAFSAAIDQLQRYVTWRDTKTALVVFNRNKGFSDVIQKAQAAVRAHPQFKSGPTAEGPSRFRYAFKNVADASREYAMTLMLFDIPTPD